MALGLLCGAAIDPAEVSLWVISVVSDAIRHVRLAPQSDRICDAAKRRFVPLATKAQCSEGGRLERSPGQEKY